MLMFLLGMIVGPVVLLAGVSVLLFGKAVRQYLRLRRVSGEQVRQEIKGLISVMDRITMESAEEARKREREWDRTKANLN